MQCGDPGKPQYSLNGDGEFVITNYNSAKPFSSFLPGIAGIHGIPMWVFYVNRGQCICSMGVQDKDHPIMEFLPANWAYQLVTSQGFRTFIKLSPPAPVRFYEPFQRHLNDEHIECEQRLSLSRSGLTLEEVNHSLKLKFRIDYCTVPNDTYAGLIRRLQIQNLDSAQIVLEGLDGLPLLVPYGINNFCLKNMRRTIEAFAEVCNLDGRAPFFRAKVEPSDRPDVKQIIAGNFYLGFAVNQSGVDLVAPIIDPSKIFGSRRDFSIPEQFLLSSHRELPNDQITEGQLPAAMGAFQASIPAGGTYTYYSIVGHASSQDQLNAMIPRLTAPDYVTARMQADRDLIDSLTQPHMVVSNVSPLDHYARQNALDNIMRGGVPHTLKGSASRRTVYLYSRKHGDLERDYNDFCLEPTYYSQGNGNFRDINQNRRCDLLINPDLCEDNILHFWNLIQLDGFNPLVLKQIRFAVTDREDVDAILQEFLGRADVANVQSFLKEPFTPGSLFAHMQDRKITPAGDPEEFIGRILDHCDKIPLAVHGEGYWIDHWTYNLDLLEIYLAVYPESFTDLLFGSDKVSFHNSPYRVQARSDKYVLWGTKPAQLNAVVHDQEKAAIIASHEEDPDLVRIEFGKGRVYKTSVFSKMLCIIVNKLASLDPEGVGVEMEADKPGWYDALNGLPGLFGSSVSESLELKRHIQFLLNHLPSYEQTSDEIAVFEELAVFMRQVFQLLADDAAAFEYWNGTATAKEQFRDRTRLGVSGKESIVPLSEIREFLGGALKKLDVGIEKARHHESGTISTYFRHEVVEFEEVGPSLSTDCEKSKDEHQLPVRIKPLRFRQIPMPLFLEGPVHYLRCRPGKDAAREFAAAVKRSALYDRSLRMYKVNASLAAEPMEVGRARVFPSGWLENESIWLHMEYKYILELLRNGLYDEFYEEFKTVCIPFLDPERYGRSILENCSFIASSAHPDPTVHGTGFVARLSGATAEFIQMLAIMTMGQRPFRVGRDEELQLCLEPALPEWLFTKERKTLRILDGDTWSTTEVEAGTFSFMFLGSILITYHNPELKSTYGNGRVSPSQWKITTRDGDVTTIEGSVIKGDMAASIRSRKVSRIDITLG